MDHPIPRKSGETESRQLVRMVLESTVPMYERSLRENDLKAISAYAGICCSLARSNAPLFAAIGNAPETIKLHEILLSLLDHPAALQVAVSALFSSRSVIFEFVCVFVAWYCCVCMRGNMLMLPLINDAMKSGNELVLVSCSGVAIAVFREKIKKHSSISTERISSTLRASVEAPNQTSAVNGLKRRARRRRNGISARYQRSICMFSIRCRCGQSLRKFHFVIIAGLLQSAWSWLYQFVEQCT